MHRLSFKSTPIFPNLHRFRAQNVCPQSDASYLRRNPGRSSYNHSAVQSGCALPPGSGSGSPKSGFGCTDVPDGRRSPPSCPSPEGSQMKNADAVGNIFNHREVVGDEEVCKPRLVLDVLHQVDNLRLNGHIERRDTLIGNDQLRVHDKRPGRCRHAAADHRKTDAGTGLHVPGARPTLWRMSATISVRSFWEWYR